MQFTNISNTGVIDANFNGHRKQEIIFLNEKNEKYRICINVTSPVSTLYKWSETKGWLFILEKNTIKDFGIDTAYKTLNTVPQNVYNPIIKSLKRLAENF